MNTLLALILLPALLAAEPPAYQVSYQGKAVPTFGELQQPQQLLKPRSGWWWNPQEPGTGLNLDIQQGSIDPEGNGLVFVSYYTYDAEGQPLWYSWAAFWKPASWAQWKQEGIIGSLETDGPVLLTRNGRCIQCTQRSPEYVDSGLGPARLRFAGTDRLVLELGGEQRKMQWMEWGDGLVDSARCSSGDDTTPSQCRWSVFEGDWWYRGFYLFANHETGRLTRFLANGYLFHSEDQAIATIRNRMNLDNYPQADVQEDPDATIAMPMVVSNTDPNMASMVENASDTPYWEELATRPNTVFFRDRYSGQEYLLAFEGWRGSLSNGFELEDHPAVYRLLYLDRDTALAVAWEDQNCWLGRVDCSQRKLGDEQLPLGYLLFKRMHPLRVREDELQLTPQQSRFWPSP